MVNRPSNCPDLAPPSAPCVYSGVPHDLGGLAVYEPPYSFDFSPAPNRALALSYRFGYACWVALLIWPLTLIAVLVLNVVLDAHDTPRGGVIVLEVATAAVALPGVGGVVLAIAEGGRIVRMGQGRQARDLLSPSGGPDVEPGSCIRLVVRPERLLDLRPPYAPGDNLRQCRALRGLLGTHVPRQQARV